MLIIDSFGKNIYVDEKLVGYVGENVLYINGKKFAEITDEGEIYFPPKKIGYVDDDGSIIINGRDVGYIEIAENNPLFLCNYIERNPLNHQKKRSPE